MKVTLTSNSTPFGAVMCWTGSILSWFLEPALAKKWVIRRWKLAAWTGSDLSCQGYEYRYFLECKNDKQVFEEWGKRTIEPLSGQADQYTLYDYWQVRPANLAFIPQHLLKFVCTSCNTHERWWRAVRDLRSRPSLIRVSKEPAWLSPEIRTVWGNWHPDKALILGWHLPSGIDLDAGRFPIRWNSFWSGWSAAFILGRRQNQVSWICLHPTGGRDGDRFGPLFSW